MRLQRLTRYRMIYLRQIILNIDTRMSQSRVIVRTERVKIICVYLTRTIPLNKSFSKKIQTSGTNGKPFSLAAAISIAVIKFSFPSVRNIPIGNCDPVRITGLLRFSSIKLNADAVYDIVSVPCSTTKPSYF